MASVPGALDINLESCFKPFHFERKIFHAAKKAFLITLMASERMDFYLIDNSRPSCSEHIQFVAVHINNFHNEACINFLGLCCRFPQEPISVKWWIRHFPQSRGGFLGRFLGANNPLEMFLSLCCVFPWLQVSLIC